MFVVSFMIALLVVSMIMGDVDVDDTLEIAIAMIAKKHAGVTKQKV